MRSTGSACAPCWARYPQIDQLTLWLGRQGRSAWERVALDALPASWRRDDVPAPRSGASDSAQRIASRIADSVSRALVEIGRADVALFIGSAGYDWLDAADALHADNVALAVLDRPLPDGRPALSMPRHIIPLRGRVPVAPRLADPGARARPRALGTP